MSPRVQAMKYLAGILILILVGLFATLPANTAGASPCEWFEENAPDDPYYTPENYPECFTEVETPTPTVTPTPTPTVTPTPTPTTTPPPITPTITPTVTPTPTDECDGTDCLPETGVNSLGLVVAGAAMICVGLALVAYRQDHVQ